MSQPTAGSQHEMPDDGSSGVGWRAHDYGRVARRLKAPLLSLLIVLPLAAVALSLAQQTLYRSSAEVLLRYQNFATALTNVPDSPGVTQDPKRIATTAAVVARVPAVAAEALRLADVRDRTPADLLNASEVQANPSADILEFAVESTTAADARRLVTAYAQAFAQYMRQLDTAPIERARNGVTERLRALTARGDHTSALYRSLLSKQEQLGTMGALETSRATVIRTADSAQRVQPRAVRNALLALGVALVLAAGLVVAADAIDTRVSTADEASRLLGGLPLLARLPPPPARLRRKQRLPMLFEPDGAQADLFRVFKTSFEFAALANNAQAVMFTSAVRREGKSTSVANLAIALARAGRRVALVDLDRRLPTLHRFFACELRPGLTEVLGGEVALEHAITSMTFNDVRQPWGLHLAADPGPREAGVEEPKRGRLDILTAGEVTATRSELVGTDAFDALLANLRERADIVLFDSSPALYANEALALTREVDGVVVVVRADAELPGTLRDLRRMLETSPAAGLGFVFTGAAVDEGYARAAYPRAQISPKQGHAV